MRYCGRIAAAVMAAGAVALGGCQGTISRQEASDLRELALKSYDEGELFAEQGNPSVALDRFDRSALLAPEPATYFMQGRMNEELGYPNDAAEPYARALTGAPDYQEARFALLALGYEAIPGESELKGDPAVGARLIDRIMSEVEVRKRMAESPERPLTPAERREQEIEIREQIAFAAQRRAPTLEEVRRIIARTPIEGEGIPSTVDPAFSGDPNMILNTYPFHFDRGRRYQRSGEMDRAAEEFRLAILADPAQVGAPLGLGDVYMELERFPAAYEVFRQSMEQFPESAQPVLKMGVYYDRTGELEFAAEYYRTALGLDPNYLAAYNNLARLAILDEAWADAVTILERGLMVDADYALAWLNLGIAHENSGNVPAAIEAYEKYVELGGDADGQSVAEVRSWIAQLRG